MDIDEIVTRDVLAGSGTPSPRWPIFFALIAGLASVLIAVLGFVAASSSSFLLECVGYGLGGVVGPAFVAVYRVIENGRAKSPTHVVSIQRGRALVAATLVTLIGASLNAWLVATELAKR